MLAAIAAAAAILSARAPADPPCCPGLPPGSFRLAGITLTGGGKPSAAAGGGGGGVADGSLDFSAATQSGLLVFF